MTAPNSWFNLEDEFPLGDGSADTATTVLCVYCGETVEIALDPGSGEHQDYIEDCPVCCSPWHVRVEYTEGVAAVELTPADGS